MKYIALLAALLMCLSTPASAQEIDWLDSWSDERQVLAINAPNLVRISDSWTFGPELGKDLHNTNSDEGWYIQATVTYSGTLLGNKTTQL